jgi:5-methyltetrahydropteroyltriglutamate--homocysteine methyltransferase
MYAKEEGRPVDREALEQRIRSAVGEVVAKQRKAGIDIVNDGEMSKPSYATYVKDRLSGFGGTGNTFVYQDLARSAIALSSTQSLPTYPRRPRVV